MIESVPTIPVPGYRSRELAATKKDSVFLMRGFCNPPDAVTRAKRNKAFHTAL